MWYLIFWLKKTSGFSTSNFKSKPLNHFPPNQTLDLCPPPSISQSPPVWRYNIFRSTRIPKQKTKPIYLRKVGCILPQGMRGSKSNLPSSKLTWQAANPPVINRKYIDSKWWMFQPATPRKLNSSPLKIGRAPKGLPSNSSSKIIIFEGRAVKFPGCMLVYWKVHSLKLT